MYALKLTCNFSVQQLGKQRMSFRHKICFKDSLTYLGLKTTPTTSIASRLFRDGNFLRIYRKTQKVFFKYIINAAQHLPHNNEFKNLYFRYYSFRDFNRILFWKIMSVNSLFNLKKLSSKRVIYYLPKERRQMVVLLWLKSIIKLSKKDYGNCNVDLFKPLIKFVYTNKNSNEIFSLKLKIYKMRMMRG